MSGNLISVLLVEDNAGDARLVHEMLKEDLIHRFDIVHVGLLSEALNMLKVEKPDVILLDLSLTDTHGIETFLTIQEASPAIPVVVINGLDDESIAVNAMQEGAQDYLVRGQVESHLLVQSIRYSIERKKAEEKIQQSYQALQVILDSMPYGVVVVGKDKTIRYANSAVHKLTGNQLKDEILGKDCKSVLCSTAPCEPCHCPFIHHKKTIVKTEKILVSKSGKRIPILKTIIPIELKGEPLLLEYFVDITDIKSAERKLRKNERHLDYLAHHDTLTGLPNRRHFNTSLMNHLARSGRNGQSLTIMLLDLDHFKTINDSLGHPAGDKLLKLVAERMKCSLRKTDIMARLGGDEFIVLLSLVQCPEDALRAAGKLRNALEPPFDLEGDEIYITTSIGVAIFPTHGKDLDTLFKNADIALYRAKEEGRNRCHLYTPEMHGTVMEKMVLKNSLHKAIEREEFLLHYQPQIDMKTGRLTGMEALIRWRHKDLGLIPPDKFITLAEDTGLIIPMGEWVLQTACRQNMAWKKAGYHPGSIAVNLSVRQFKQADIVTSIERILHDTGMDARDLELEITESTLIYDVECAVSILNRLNELGIRISIDDFGTGYSSLNYLKKLPLYALKIDRSFIREITIDPDDEAIVRAIVAMAHSMRLKVVAEGVETQEQLAFLHSLGCDLGQGYYFSRPLPPDEIENFITGS